MYAEVPSARTSRSTGTDSTGRPRSDAIAGTKARIRDTRVPGSTADAKRLRWAPNTETDLCYYRVYHNGVRIGSTVATEFIDAGPTGIGILPIGLGLLNSVVTLGSFAVILWNLSGTAPLHVFGTTWAIPGYLFWAALIYAVIGTALTHLVGRALTALNFQQQRYEADFRFNLVRVRESSEQIALLDGEHAERDRLLVRFGNVVANWLAIMTRQKKLTFLTAGYGQVSSVFPFVVVSPAYFAGAIQLGGLMQIANAFGRMQEALSVFITVYRNFAQWRAVVERLAGFDQSVATARTVAVMSAPIHRTKGSA